MLLADRRVQAKFDNRVDYEFTEAPTPFRVRLSTGSCLAWTPAGNPDVLDGQVTCLASVFSARLARFELATPGFEAGAYPDQATAGKATTTYAVAPRARQGVDRSLSAAESAPAHRPPGPRRPHLVSDQQGGCTMAIKEYEPGTAFPGVIGRTSASRRRPGRARCAPSQERRTCSSSSSTTPASGSSAATARRFARPTSIGSRRTACASTTCTRPRSARRAARASSPAATTTRTRWRASPRARRAIPGSNGLIPFENGFLSEILLAHGYNTFAVGKWHLTPTEQSQPGRPLRSLAARPRLRALLRLPGRRHAPVLPGPRLRQPPGPAAEDARGGLPPDRGSRRPGDRVHRRRQAGRARQAVLHVLLHRRDARAASRAAGVGRQVQGAVRRRLGRLPREGVRAAR